MKGLGAMTFWELNEQMGRSLWTSDHMSVRWKAQTRRSPTSIIQCSKKPCWAAYVAIVAVLPKTESSSVAETFESQKSWVLILLLLSMISSFWASVYPLLRSLCLSTYKKDVIKEHQVVYKVVPTLTILWFCTFKTGGCFCFKTKKKTLIVTRSPYPRQAAWEKLAQEEAQARAVCGLFS